MRRVRDGLRELFALPDGYEVLLSQRRLELLLGRRSGRLVRHRAQHLVCGEFSQKFATVTARAPHLDDPIVVSAEPGDAPDLVADPDADVVAWPHNETSTGVMLPVRRPAHAMRSRWSTRRRGPAVCRSTSSQADVYYFAPQKSFGSEGGLWLALVSPAALERIDELSAATDRWQPASLSLAHAVENSRLDQTYNTPAIATLLLLADQLDWMLGNGGLEFCVARTTASSAHLYGWAERTAVGDAVRRRPGEALARRRHHRLRRRTSTRPRLRKPCAATGSSTSSPTASSAATSCASACSRPSTRPTSRR